jgi:GMC oxidoreductase
MLFELTSEFRPAGSYDVCIIGAGAAGIVVARRLARAGHSVLLAEGGGLEYSDQSQSIYRGDVIGDPYFELDTARLRYFGGTTNHWSGESRPLDARDFQPKPYVAFTTWPIARRDLDPYLDETLDILGIASIPDDVPLPGTTDLQQIFWAHAGGLSFGEKYSDEIRRSENISLLLNANLIGFDFHDSRVVAARFENYDRHGVTLDAKIFILACGGIENSRILLIENDKFNNALGNAAGLVGRYFTEHPHFTIGESFLYGDSPFQRHEGDPAIYLTPTADFMERAEILNCRISLDHVQHREGWQGFVQTAMCDVAPEMSAELLEAIGRRFICSGRVRAIWEQEPRPENRIALSDEVDFFGHRRAQMIWRKSPMDKKTFTTMALRVGRYLAEADAGRLRLDDWVLAEHGEYPARDRIGGRHHMGGTRMAASPRDGVVDKDCRVFGTANLFIAGSSVFPNAGQSNPTLTIVQLALRLADFLSAELLRAGAGPLTHAH